MHKSTCYSSLSREVVGARDEAVPQPRDGEGRHREDAEGTHVGTLIVVGCGFHGLRHLKVGGTET